MRLPAGIILWYYGVCAQVQGGGKACRSMPPTDDRAFLMLSGKSRGPLPGRKGSPGRGACGGLLRMGSVLVGRQPLTLNGPEFGPDSANKVGL